MKTIAFAAPCCCSVIMLGSLMVGCGGSDETSQVSSTDPTSAPAAGAPDSMAGGAEPGGVDTANYDAGGAEDMGGPAEGGGPAAMSMSAGAPGMSDPGAGGHDAGGGPPGMSNMAGMAGGAGYAGGADSAAYDPAAMQGEMAGAGLGGTYDGAVGGQYGAGGGGGQPSRPADVRQWTDEQLLAAVDQRDTRVLQAIQMKAESSGGDPAFVQLMTEVLGNSSGDASGAAGQTFSFPGLGGGSPGGLPGAAPLPNGQTPIPPGGASLDPIYRRTRSGQSKAVDSIDRMIGESLLSYVPQAAQGVRTTADNLQNSAANAGGAGPTSVGQNSIGYQPAGPGPAMTQESAAGFPGAAGAGTTPGAEYPGTGYPGTAGPEAMSGYPAGGGADYEGSGYGQTQGQPGGNLQDKDLVEAVVRALVTNNSPQAWTALEGIVAGSVPTPLNADTNTELVIKEVFSSRTPNLTKAEPLLAAAVADSTQNPNANPGTLRILAAIAQHPADYFLNLGTPPPPPPPRGSGPGQNQMSGAMAAGGPGYPGAAMAGYPAAGMATGGAIPGAGMSTQLGGGAEGGFDGGGVDPGGFDGSGEYGPQGPPPPMASAPPLPRIPVAEAALAPVARILWAPSVAAQIAQQLQSAPDPGAVTELLALASTFPSDDVRHSIHDLLQRSHSGGATSLIGSGLFQNISRDPGMLTVLKTLPRERPGTSDGPGGPLPGNANESWTQATQQVVISLRNRLVSVANDPELAFSGLLPVRLHKNAVPERSIRIDVPGRQAELLGDAAPDETTIYFTRVRVVPERMKQMQDIVDHYENRTKGIKHEDRASGILWYDGVKGSSNGTTQTMDVVVEQVKAPAANGAYGAGGGFQAPGGESSFGGPPGGGAQGGGTQFTIDVIVVVTKDPSVAADNAKVTSSSP